MVKREWISFKLVRNVIRLPKSNKSLYCQAQSVSGQITVETVLIGTIVAGVIAFVSQSLRSSSWPGMMIKEPWGKVSGMVESGVWSKKGPAEARKMHPNFNMKRRVSLKGTIE